MENKKRNEIIGKLIVAFMLFLLWGGSIAFGYPVFRDNLHCTEKVEAVVVDIKTIEHHSVKRGKNYTYAPVFQYYYDGIEYRVVSKYDNEINSYEINDKQDILINPENPTQLYIPRQTIMDIILAIIFAALGLFLVILIAKNMSDKKKQISLQ